jgi:ribonuclease P protein component
LGRALRLRRSGDFTRVERQGVRASGRFVVVVAKKSGKVGRVGFTVSKKVGNAVARNFVKRRLREIARTHKALWQGRDLVIIAKPEAAFQELRALEADLLAALKKLEESARGPSQQSKPKPPPA